MVGRLTLEQRRRRPAATPRAAAAASTRLVLRRTLVHCLASQPGTRISNNEVIRKREVTRRPVGGRSASYRSKYLWGMSFIACGTQFYYESWPHFHVVESSHGKVWELGLEPRFCRCRILKHGTWYHVYSLSECIAYSTSIEFTDLLLNLDGVYYSATLVRGVHP